MSNYDDDFIFDDSFGEVAKQTEIRSVEVDKSYKKLESIKDKVSKKDLTKESIEMTVCKQIIKDYSISKLDELSGSSILMYFDKNDKVWKALSNEEDLKGLVTQGIKKSGYLSLLSKSMIESTAFVLCSLSYSDSNFMPRMKKGTEIIAINDYVDNYGDVYSYLKINAENCELIKADKNFGVTKFFNLYIDKDKLEYSNNRIFYKPYVDFNKKGLLQDKIFTEYNAQEGFLETLQEYLGDSMLFLNSQVWAILKGTGMNAKGVTLELMNRSTSKFATSINLSSDGKFDLQKLPGKEYIICDENDKKINEGRTKKLLGESIIEFDRKFMSPVNGFIYRGKGIIATNNGLSTSDKGFSMIRRFTIFEFQGNVKESQQIPGLADLITDGGSYINPQNREETLYNESQLNEWIDFLLVGAMRVVKRGILLKGDKLPITLIMHKQEMISEMIPHKNFIKEMNIEPSDTEVISKEDLYDLWIAYCKRNGHVGIGTKITFLSEFRKIFDLEYPNKLKESKTKATNFSAPRNGYKLSFDKDNYVQRKTFDNRTKEDIIDSIDIDKLLMLVDNDLINDLDINRILLLSKNKLLKNIDDNTFMEAINIANDIMLQKIKSK